MRKLQSRALPALLTGLMTLAVFPVAVAAVAAEKPAEGALPKAMLGSWHLVSLEHGNPDGSLFKEEATGKLVFTPEGTMAVQVMYKDPAVSGRYATGGYEASFGRIAVDPVTHTFTYRVEGALVRTLIGTDTRRGYELSEKRFSVIPATPTEHFRIIWERD